MNELPIKIICPLGATCQEIKDNTIHRCAWYMNLAGADPQTGEMIDSWKCSMVWQPILMIENANTNRGQTEAICSLREETIKRQDAALITMLQGTNNAKNIESIESR